MFLFRPTRILRFVRVTQAGLELRLRVTSLRQWFSYLTCRVRMEHCLVLDHREFQQGAGFRATHFYFRFQTSTAIISLSLLARRIALLLVGTVFVAVSCLSMVAFGVAYSHNERSSLVQRMSDSFLFKTPTLKSLVGTFMTEQGAPKGDISVRSKLTCPISGPSENILRMRLLVPNKRSFSLSLAGS
jgi:hypothetical protein